MSLTLLITAPVCKDKNAHGYCHIQNKWACTNERHKEWFSEDCQKLCGKC